MKKFMMLMIGLSLVLGTSAFAEDKSTDSKKETKKKGKKKKTTEEKK